MAKERQKWTREEEEALYAGVDKHGQGKWKVILMDPDFSSTLSNRSNIDLKDKWRNVSVNREKVKNPILEFEGEITTDNSPLPLTVVPLIEYDSSTPAPSKTTVDRRTAPDYEAMILEALSTIEDPNGADFNTILGFLEERFELPENYKRSVTSKLRRLVLTGELEKVDNRFKIYKGTSSGTESLQKDDEPSNDDNDNNDDEARGKCESPVATETIEDATNYAARAIAITENTEQKAIEACAEADRFAALAEESIGMLQLAQELHAICLRDGYVVFAP